MPENPPANAGGSTLFDGPLPSKSVLREISKTDLNIGQRVYRLSENDNVILYGVFQSTGHLHWIIHPKGTRTFYNQLPTPLYVISDWAT